jgi:hypothetical protein
LAATRWPATSTSQCFPALTVYIGQALTRQRIEPPHMVRRNPNPFSDSISILIVHEQQVPDHALLDISLALRQESGECLHKLVPLPVHHRLVTICSLLIVVLTLDRSAREASVILRVLLNMPRIRRLAEPAVHARLVVNMRVPVPIEVIGRLAAALVCVRLDDRGIDWQLQVVWPHAIPLRVGVREGASDENLVVREVQPINQDARLESSLLTDCRSP